MKAPTSATKKAAAPRKAPEAPATIKSLNLPKGVVPGAILLVHYNAKKSSPEVAEVIAEEGNVFRALVRAVSEGKSLDVTFQYDDGTSDKSSIDLVSRLDSYGGYISNIVVAEAPSEKTPSKKATTKKTAPAKKSSRKEPVESTDGVEYI